MALQRLCATRLLNMGKSSVQDARLGHSPIPKHTQSPQIIRRTNLQREHVTPLESEGFVSRFMHFKVLEDENQTQKPIDLNNITRGEKEKQNYLHHDRLTHAPLVRSDDSIFIKAEDTRKLLKLAHVLKLRAKLKEIPDTQITYSEFIQICVGEGQDENQGMEFARLLDECGNVLILGNIVFLRPDQVAKSIGSLISNLIVVPDDTKRKEFKELNLTKSFIDRKARAQVQGELYLGLFYFLLQTFGFMRLTFWETTWDEMEPICYFVTTIHFIIAYDFFLITSTEPSFESYFHTRFKTKQKKLMKIHNFDADKYEKLCDLFGIPNLAKASIDDEVRIFKKDP